MDFLDTTRPRALILIAAWRMYFEWPHVRDTENPEILDADRIFQTKIETLADFCKSRATQLIMLRQVPATAQLSPARELLAFRYFDHWY